MAPRPQCTHYCCLAEGTSRSAWNFKENSFARQRNLKPALLNSWQRRLLRLVTCVCSLVREWDPALTLHFFGASDQLAASDAEHGDEDLTIFLQDSEALKSTLSSSNDMHVGKLIATEDGMRDTFNKSVRTRPIVSTARPRQNAAHVCVACV